MSHKTDASLHPMYWNRSRQSATKTDSLVYLGAFGRKVTKLNVSYFPLFYVQGLRFLNYLLNIIALDIFSYLLKVMIKLLRVSIYR